MQTRHWTLNVLSRASNLHLALMSSEMSRKTQTAQNRRLLTLLDALPVEGQHGLSPRELAERMSRSFGVDEYRDPEGCKPGTGEKRLQRDLAALEDLFGPAVVIKASEIRNRPLYWKSAAVKLPGLDAHTALAFKVAGEALRQVLPPATYTRLAEHFAAGERALAQLTRIDDWHNKVAVLPRGQPLLPPVVDGKIQETIQQTLFEGRQLKLRYRKKWDADPTDYPALSPAGLLVRGKLVYLLAFKPDDEHPRQFALHRVLTAEKLYTDAEVPTGFKLADYIACGEPGVVVCNAPIALHLRLTGGAGEHLRETPLATDQLITESGEPDTLELRATVAWTYELQWWLQGLGPNVEVLAPAALREVLAQALRAAADQYQA